MASNPVTLDALITSVRSAAPDEPLSQLEEAARLRDEVGELTDALLGHFVDQARRGGASWSQIGEALGVSKQAVQQKHSAKSLPMERVTERTRIAIEAGVTAAQQWGHDTVDVEHVLLGILAVPECLAAKLLAEQGVTAAHVATELERLGGRGDGDGAVVPAYSPAAARVLSGSLEQSLMLGHNYIGTEHVLLSLLVDPGEVVGALIQGSGLTHAVAKARIVEILSGFTGG